MICILVFSSCSRDFGKDYYYKSILTDSNYSIQDYLKDSNLDSFDLVSPDIRNELLALAVNLDFQTFSSYLDEELYQLHVRKQSILDLKAVHSTSSKLDFEDVEDQSQVSFEKFKLDFLNGSTPLSSEGVAWLKAYLLKCDIRSYKDLYRYTGYSFILGEYYMRQNQMEKYWSILLNSFHVVCKYDESLNYIKDKILYDLLNSMSKETGVHKYQSIIRKLFSKLSSDGNDSFNRYMIKAYLLEEFPTMFPQEERLSLLRNALDKATCPSQKMKVYFNLGYYFEVNSELEKARGYYEEAISQFSDPCVKHFHTILLYQIGVTFEPDEISSLLKKLKNYEDCPIDITAHVDFVLPNYIDLSLWSSDERERVALILQSRKKAEELYPSFSSLHLQDFYISNYSSLLDAYSQEILFKKEDIEIVTSTCLDTRNKEKFRQQIISSSEGDAEKGGKIKELLHDVNEFRDYNTTLLRSYDSLFYNYLTIDENVPEFSPVLVDVDSIVTKLKRDSSSVLNITKTIDKYHYYYLGEEGLTKGSIGADELDSIALYFYERIRSRDEIDYSMIASFFPFLKRSTANKLVIVYDGTLSSLPLQEIFGFKTVYIYSDLEQYMNSELVRIEDCALYTYSDSTSIVSKAKRNYPELNYSMDEIENISVLLESVNVTIESATRGLKYLDRDLLHLSTHAYSSTQNRMDNYFILRNDSGLPLKKYGFEYYNESNLPQVVILSACDSGIGLHSSGAGVQSLSRAFLDNGTKTVIKTLWKVNEKATAEFMVKMYSHWVTGISLYDALEKTKDGFNNHPAYAHPYYWAGFVLEGNPHIYLKMESAE